MAPTCRRPKKMAGAARKTKEVVPLPNPCRTPKRAARVGVSRPHGGARMRMPHEASVSPPHRRYRGGRLQHEGVGRARQ